MSGSIAVDFRRDVKRAPLAIEGLEDVADDERTRALTNWRARASSEHASARVFAALVPQMMRAGIDRRVVLRTSAMVAQELEHALLCAKVVAALGGDAEIEIRADLPAVPEHEDAPPLEAVLRNVLSVSCMSETVAVALVATEREMAGTDALRDVLEKILADEVKHARLAWKLLETVAPMLDRTTRDRLDEYLVQAFEHQLQFHGLFLEWPSTSDRGAAIGAPDGPANWACFVRTVEDVIVPGLEKHGLAGRAAWRAAITA